MESFTITKYGVCNIFVVYTFLAIKNKIFCTHLINKYLVVTTTCSEHIIGRLACLCDNNYVYSVEQGTSEYGIYCPANHLKTIAMTRSVY